MAQESLFLLTVVSLVLLPVCVESCSCAMEYKHIQDIFCDSTFLVKGRVVNDTIITGLYQGNFSGRPYYRDSRVYTVQILRRFKDTEAISAKKYIEITTNTNDGICGVTLWIGDIYLFNEFGMDTCSHGPWHWNYQFNSHIVKPHMIHERLKNCNCKIHPCYDPYDENCPGGTKDWCNDYQEHWRSDSCYTKYGVCGKGNDDQCTWKRTNSLKECLERH